MTAPLIQDSTTTCIGRRLKDCETGEIFTVIGVDADGDYVLYVEDNCDSVASPDEVHEPDKCERSCYCYKWAKPGEPCEDCVAGSCIDCYEWIKEKP